MEYITDVPNPKLEYLVVHYGGVLCGAKIVGYQHAFTIPTAFFLCLWQKVWQLRPEAVCVFDKVFCKFFTFDTQKLAHKKKN